MTDEWRKDCELWLNYGLQKRGCVKIDTSSFLFFLYLVYDIIRYLLQLCC